MNTGDIDQDTPGRFVENTGLKIMRNDARDGIELLKVARDSAGEKSGVKPRDLIIRISPDKGETKQLSTKGLDINPGPGPMSQAYVERIEATCMALETFPKRGTRRDDIRSGLRTLGFERRVTIVFQVQRTAVVIVRVFYGGQDYERVLRGQAEE